MHKPTGISSAQVLRDLQNHFIPSRHFADALVAERERVIEESIRQRRHRKDKAIRLKLGHGGTLDPLATGILICGVGKATKELVSFLGCKKTYETVVLFGAATDTYDRLGKVVARAPFQHITRQAVETAIKEKFTGEIKQTPPIFSALRIDGKHAYEYAREGKELPRELADRDMKVDECSILEWFEPGTHEFQWPTEEAPDEEKEVMKKVYNKVDEVETSVTAERGTKRPASPELTTDGPDEGEQSDNLPQDSESKRQKVSETEAQSSSITAEDSNIAEQEPSAMSPAKKGPPAAKIRLTVSSGFYVRSFCHDLGLALGSLGLMSSLVRSRQGEFDLSNDEMVLSYSDIEKGEDFWAPKLTRLLEQWPDIRKKMVTEKSLDAGKDSGDGKPRGSSSNQGKSGKQGDSKWSTPRQRGNWRSKTQQRERRRQNTSSPESS